MIFAGYSEAGNFGPNILNILWLIGKFPGKDANISCDMTTQSAGQHFWYRAGEFMRLDVQLELK